MARGPFALPPAQPFTGAGVYALFYKGNFGPYRRVRSPKSERAIYVGSAVPAGSRKGLVEGGKVSGPVLYSRLAHHAGSISAATNLDLADFTCRYLVVTPLWITMAERFLITNFRPIWNLVIEGFGLHDPGKGRHQGEIPWWDSLHPGRTWAKRLRQTRTAAAAITRLDEWFEMQESHPEAARKQAERIADKEVGEARP